MKKSKLCGWACALSLLVGCFSSAWADTALQLLRGTSDAFKGNLDVQVVVNSDDVATGFQYISPKKTESFDISHIADGIVLMRKNGYDVITLKSADFDPEHGGTLDIHYLHSALSSEYQDLYLDLVRTGDQWELLANDQAGHHVVSQAFFKANRFLGQLIGVDSITLN